MAEGQGYFVSLSLYKKPPRAAPAFHSLGSRTPFFSSAALQKKIQGSHLQSLHPFFFVSLKKWRRDRDSNPG